MEWEFGVSVWKIPQISEAVVKYWTILIRRFHYRHKRASYCENWSEDEDKDSNYTPENSDIDEEEEHALPEIKIQTPKRKKPKSSISTPKVP